MEDSRIQWKMAENIVSGLEKMGVTLSIDVLESVNTPIYVRSGEDTDSEVKAFSRLLDDPMTEELGGGNLLLTSGESYARLSGDGLFEVYLS